MFLFILFVVAVAVAAFYYVKHKSAATITKIESEVTQEVDKIKAEVTKVVDKL